MEISELKNNKINHWMGLISTMEMTKENQWIWRQTDENDLVGEKKMNRVLRTFGISKGLTPVPWKESKKNAMEKSTWANNDW